MPVSRSISIVTAWQALEYIQSGDLYRLDSSRPSSAPGGSAVGLSR